MNRSTPKSSNAVFNQAELIAKYGEEIFSRSSPSPVPAKSPLPVPATSTPIVDKKKNEITTGKVGALCSQLESKAKIRS